MDRFYTTSRGVKIEILAIQSLMEKFEASQRLPNVPEELRGILGDAMPKPEQPMYEAKTITGIIEKHFHNETTLKTQEERDAWQKYQDALQAYEADREKKQARLVCLYGVKFDMPENGSWEKMQKDILGIDVPQDPVERKVHYFNTEIVGGLGDVLEITKRCMLAGLPEEKLAEAEALFQRSLAGFAEANRLADSQGKMDSKLPL